LVLLIVLWTAAILLILAGTTRQTSRLDTKLSVFTTQEVRCKWASRAGAEKAIAILNEDDRTLDGPADLWAYNPEDLVDVPMLGCHYTVRVVDEAGKLNVNTATRDQLLGFFDWGMDVATADAIIDWRDTDDEPGEEGVEAGYYLNLPYRYTIHNRPFKTIREMLKVKGVTDQLFYGEDTNFNGQLDDNEKDGSQTAPLDDGDAVLDLGWIGFLTCYVPQTVPQDPNGTTKVNINQATAAQLQELGLTSAQAQAVIDSRPSSGYTSIGALISTNTSTSSSSQTTGQTTSAAGNTGTTATPPLDVATFKSIVDLITVGTSSTATQASASTQSSASTTTDASSSNVAATSSTPTPTTVNPINVNTASLEVLVALWGGTDQAYEVAQNVVSYRDGTMTGLESIGELLDVPSMTADLFAQVVDQITVRSNVFTIYCVAKADQTGISGASWFTEAVVDRSQSPVKILYWYQGACP
jgi:DNA uptake protein ComE-like DNA-binding protein